MTMTMTTMTMTTTDHPPRSGRIAGGGGGSQSARKLSKEEDLWRIRSRHHARQRGTLLQSVVRVKDQSRGRWDRSLAAQ